MVLFVTQLHTGFPRSTPDGIHTRGPRADAGGIWNAAWPSGRYVRCGRVSGPSDTGSSESFRQSFGVHDASDIAKPQRGEREFSRIEMNNFIIEHSVQWRSSIVPAGATHGSLHMDTWFCCA